MLPTHERTMVVVPAQGMIDVRDAMTDILAEFGKEDNGKLLACLHCIVAIGKYCNCSYRLRKQGLLLTVMISDDSDNDGDDGMFLFSHRHWQ